MLLLNYYKPNRSEELQHEMLLHQTTIQHALLESFRLYSLGVSQNNLHYQFWPFEGLQVVSVTLPPNVCPNCDTLAVLINVLLANYGTEYGIKIRVSDVQCHRSGVVTIYIRYKAYGIPEWERKGQATVFYEE